MELFSQNFHSINKCILFQITNKNENTAHKIAHYQFHSAIYNLSYLTSFEDFPYNCYNNSGRVVVGTRQAGGSFVGDITFALNHEFLYYSSDV